MQQTMLDPPERRERNGRRRHPPLEPVPLRRSRTPCLPEATGGAEEAFQRARLGDGPSRMAEVVWSNLATPLPDGERPLERWLDSLPDEELWSDPRLALAAGWRALETGERGHQWTATAELAGGDEPNLDGDIRGALALLRAASSATGAWQMARDADLAVSLTAENAWRCLAYFLAGVARSMLGQATAAMRRLSQAEQLSRRLNVPSVEAQSLAQQAALAFEDGDWAEGEALIDRAESLIDRFGLHSDLTMVLAFASSALDRARRSRRVAAVGAAQRAERLLAKTSPDHMPWLGAQARIVLARTHVLLGHPGTARALLFEAQTAAACVREAPDLGRRLGRVWSMLTRPPLATVVGATAVTSAELRVVQLLPTHLSFHQIGAALQISRNTVKTQAISAYRKLGVSSRGEAVASARALGLLSE